MPTRTKQKDLKRSHIDTRVSREEFRRIRELFPNGRQSKGTDLSEVIRTLLMMYVNNEFHTGRVRDFVRARMQSQNAPVVHPAQNWQQP